MNRTMSHPVHTAAAAFAQRLDRAVKNEADSVRARQTHNALKIATAPLTIALAAAVAAAVLLIVWSPAFVETRQGDVCFLRVLLWSAAVGVATFTGPAIGRAILLRKKSKSASAGGADLSAIEDEDVGPEGDFE